MASQPDRTSPLGALPHNRRLPRRIPLLSQRRVLVLNPAIISGLILFGAITFNALLAIVNANVMRLSSAEVVLSEVALVGGAVCLLYFHKSLNKSKEALPWIFLCWLLLFFALLIGIGNNSFSPKFIRDVILIPVFIIAGMAYVSSNFVWLFARIHAVIFGILTFEAITPAGYGRLFNVPSYYGNTRGFGGDVWHGESTLFLSAVRPDDRFLLNGFDLHRMSSVFLEPVSLGNYCIVAVILILTFWKEMTLRMKIFLSVTTLALLVGSDGRLATMVILLLLVVYFVIPYLPRYINILYLPAAVLMAWLLTEAFGFVPHGDDFPGRIAKTVHLLGSLDVIGLLGLRTDTASVFMDSGISYFIATQSILGVIAIWIFISLGLDQRYLAGKIFVHSICIYISLNLLVSYSLFSIKTAALVWFAYGYLYARQRRRDEGMAVRQARNAPFAFRGG